MIDPGSLAPPYLQLAAMLRTAIERGHYAPGQQLPSAEELGRRYGCGLKSARKALRLLADNGLAETDHTGTYVYPKPP